MRIQGSFCFGQQGYTVHLDKPKASTLLPVPCAEGRISNRILTERGR